MKKLFILDESERERILNMHTSATSRQYLSEQSADYNDIKNALQAAAGGAGTDEEGLVNVFKSIPINSFDSIIDKLQSDTINGEEGLIGMLNDELGTFNIPDIIEINKIFKEKSKKYGLTWRTSGLRSKTVSDIKLVSKGSMDSVYDDFYSKFPCLKNDNVKQNTNIGKDNNGFYYFIMNNKYVRININGITEILDGNQYKRQMKKDGQGKEVPALTYCPEAVTENTNRLRQRRLNEQSSYFVPGIDSEPTSTEEEPTSTEKKPETKQEKLSSGGNLLKRGSRSDEVVGIKMRLNKVLPNVIQDLEINTSDDNYNGKTVAAVAYFQAKNNLKVDGIVGPETRGALSKIQIEDAEGGTDA